MESIGDSLAGRLGEAGELGVEAAVPEYLEWCGGSAKTERRLPLHRSGSRQGGSGARTMDNFGVREEAAGSMSDREAQSAIEGWGKRTGRVG